MHCEGKEASGKYGPRSEQVQNFIDSLPSLPWLKNVGKPFNKPDWCEVLDRVYSWDEARGAVPILLDEMGGLDEMNIALEAAIAAAGEEAREAAALAAGNAFRKAVTNIPTGFNQLEPGLAACEIMGGIEDGYYSHLMEVYRTGHWPVHFDGKKLVVF